jgi:hypothetical protein
MRLRGMRKQHAQSLVLAAAAVGSTLVLAPSAHASNPLEYPDNGAASFSRGGAWLATANEPIAAHYNPAGLAIQGSGFSIDQNLNFEKVCFDRHGPNGAPEGPDTNFQYIPTCNSRGGFPNIIPSISFTWRATKRLGIGVALVPPATYGTAQGSYPAMSLGLHTPLLAGGVKGAPVYQQIPAPYRYMGLDQKSTIIFPTLSVGYELFHNFRIGAGFISGIAIINTTVGGIGSEPQAITGDHAGDPSSDSFSTVHTKDLFVPGAIVALHWSLTPNVDVAAWGRWISDIRSTHGDLTAYSQVYNASTLDGLQPICRRGAGVCGPQNNVAIPNYFGNEAFRELRVPIPPEVRIGVRFHLPRSERGEKAPKLGMGTGFEPSRDPLHDDLFDVEVDGSYSANSRANTTEVRFADNGQGMGLQSIVPVGKLPPNADQWNGYIDSYGIRFGGQVNVIQDKLGLRGGTWLETRSQDPAWLKIGVVGGMRGGFGGGIVVRQGFLDISLGYQHQWSNALDNGGVGKMRTTITSSTPEPNLTKEPPGVSAADRTQYRSGHTVNDGRLTQSADAFTLGGTVHF